MQPLGARFPCTIMLCFEARSLNSSVAMFPQETDISGRRLRLRLPSLSSLAPARCIFNKNNIFYFEYFFVQKAHIYCESYHHHFGQVTACPMSCQ